MGAVVALTAGSEIPDVEVISREFVRLWGPSTTLYSGRAGRHMLVIISKVESRQRKDAKVYLVLRVVIWIAFGITKAVIFFSSAVISSIVMESYKIIQLVEVAFRLGRTVRIRQ